MKIGVIGGGQLGRMLALAGTPLGMNFAFLDPAPDACAAALGEHLRADYGDQDHLRQLADEVDLVTFEFESVPAETVAFLSQFVPVYPSAEALRIADDIGLPRFCAVQPHYSLVERATYEGPLQQFVAEELYGDIEPIEEVLVELTSYQLEEAERVHADGVALFGQLTWIMAAVGAGITLLAILISALVTGAIRKNLGKARELAQAVAIGDLSARAEVTSRDEVRDLVDALNTMASNLRAPWQAARELLWAAAIVTALIPLVHGAMSGLWLWTSAQRGYWPLFWVDGVALAMAIGFAAMARASSRRAIHGEPNSVWARPQRLATPAP